MQENVMLLHICYDNVMEIVYFAGGLMRMKEKIGIVDILIKLSYYCFLIVLFPILFFNQQDYKANIKSNLLYKSFIVKILEKHPLLYEVSIFVWNFPMFNKIYSILPKLSGKVLQVGCGTGLLNTYYKNKNDIDFVNLDINMAYIKYGYRKSRFKSYLCASIYSVPLEDKSFDVIIFARCFHHIRKHKSALSECLRLLKDNGKIIIIDPVSLSEQSNQSYLTNTPLDGVVWRFSKSTLEKYIRKIAPSQLSVKSLEYFRQKHITNYNSQYPHADAVIVLEKEI